MIQTICVCGAGTMGSGIAQVAAQSKYRTILFDLNEGVLDKAKASIHKNLSALAEKGKISAEEKEAIYNRILFTNMLNDCVADLVIEAIIEKIEAKVDLFIRLAAINNEQTIFASNTSSLSVTEIAKRLPYPGNVIGMHFFNPAPLMKLVEIVNTTFTKQEITDAVYTLTKQFGKTPVICKDAPGFIVNRVARHYYLEGLKLAENAAADFETIDAVLEASGFKMGPFRLMDLIGNDINFAVTTSLYEACGKPARFTPSPIQEEKVKSGKLGRKTGEGYYKY